MSDAWEILAANATDTTDAWAALNSQQAGGAIPGKAVDEIPFSLSGVVHLSATVSPVAVSAIPVESGGLVVGVSSQRLTYTTIIETAPIAEV